MSTLFKEKAYKVLYEQYKAMYSRILHRATNALQYGQKDDHEKLIRTIVETGNYPESGLISKADQQMVETLQYLLDDDESVR